MKPNCQKLAPLCIALTLLGALALSVSFNNCTECDSVHCSEVEADSQSVYQPTGLTMPEQSLSTLTPVDAKMAEMPDPTVMVPTLPVLSNQLPGMMVPMPAMGPMGMMPSTAQQMPGIPVLPGMAGIPSPVMPALLTGEQSTPAFNFPGRTALPHSPTPVAAPGGLTPAIK